MSRRLLRYLVAAAALAPVVRPAAAEAQRREPASYRSWIDTTFAFVRSGHVDVAQISGDVVVRAWDHDEIRIRAWSEHGRVDPSLSSTRAVLRVQPSEADGPRGSRMGDSGYELTVPRGVRVKAVSTSGEVQVVGTRGEVEASSTSGDVTVDDAAGRATVSALSGDVIVRGVAGDLMVKALSGDVDVRDVRGDVRATTVSGDIVLRGIEGRVVSARSTSGDLLYDGAFAREGRYELVTHSGDVLLAMSPDAAVEVSMQTFSGALSTDFPITLGAGTRGSTRPRTLEFTLGDGGARLRVETFSGEVVLRRGGR